MRRKTDRDCHDRERASTLPGAFVGGPITGGDTFPGRQIGEILSIKIKIFKRFLKDVENFQESFPEIRRVSISVSPSSHTNS